MEGWQKKAVEEGNEGEERGGSSFVWCLQACRIWVRLTEYNVRFLSSSIIQKCLQKFIFLVRIFCLHAVALKSQ